MTFGLRPNDDWPAARRSNEACGAPAAASRSSVIAIVGFLAGDFEAKSAILRLL
jgi:hypothetical protein